MSSPVNAASNMGGRVSRHRRTFAGRRNDSFEDRTSHRKRALRGRERTVRVGGDEPCPSGDRRGGPSDVVVSDALIASDDHRSGRTYAIYDLDARRIDLARMPRAADDVSRPYAASSEVLSNRPPRGDDLLSTELYTHLPEPPDDFFAGRARVVGQKTEGPIPVTKSGHGVHCMGQRTFAEAEHSVEVQQEHVELLR